MVKLEVKTPYTFLRELSVGGSIVATGRQAKNVKADCEARYNDVAYLLEAAIAPRTLNVKLSSPLSEGPLQLDADWSPLTRTIEEPPSSSSASGSGVILNLKLYGGASGRRQLTARYAISVDEATSQRTSYAFVLLHENKLWTESEKTLLPTWFSRLAFLNSDIRVNYTCAAPLCSS